MYFEDFAVGQRFELKPVTIDKQDMLCFAQKYDPLPLHLDEDYAKAGTFRGLIAPGVMSFMSVWAEFARLDVFGDALVAGSRTEIRWFAPVYAGDTLYGEAVVTKLAPGGQTGLVEVTIQAKNQHGKLVLSDVTDVMVRANKSAITP